MSNKTIDIFIRTYPKDFFLLNYCLHSIRKFVTGYRNIIINVRSKNYNELVKWIDLTGCTVIQSHDFDDKIDYCGQQICKLIAYIWSDAEYFYYIDSDCIFYNNLNIQEKYFNNEGKVILFKEYWNNVQDAKKWQKCLQRLNILTEFETMRRLPQVYPADVLPKIREHIEKTIGLDIINSCLTVYKECGFSEFNIIGSYIYLYDQSKSNLYFYDPSLNEIPSKQFWSHENHSVLKAEIEKLLNI